MPSLAERSKPGMQKYQAAVKRAKDSKPGTVFKLDWHTTRTREEFLTEYYDKILNNAINARGGIEFKGRKFDPDYQVSLIRDKHRLEDIKNRICVYQFETKEVESRFSDRLASYLDN
jgi:hypothetical protein